MTRPKHTKPDTNQAQIMKDLRSLGFDVDDIHDLPDLPDMIVSGDKYPTTVVDGKGFFRCACSVRVEVKSKQGLISDKQLEYYDKLKNKESYIIARSTQDVLDWFSGS